MITFFLATSITTIWKEQNKCEKVSIKLAESHGRASSTSTTVCVGARHTAIRCTAVCRRHKELSHAALVRRSRAKAISAFQEGLQSLTVKGTTWDVQQPVADVTAEIDAHLSKLRAQKVIYLLSASVDWCILPCARGRLVALSAQDILQ